MTETQFIQLKHAIAIINSAIAERPPTDHAGNCPVVTFALRHLARTSHDVDLSVEELWDMYRPIAEAGNLAQLQKSDFFRRLPFALSHVFHIKKSHNIKRDGRRVRGFRGVIYSFDDIDWMPKLKCTDGQGEPPSGA